MIATITAALMTLYAAATAQAESIVRRIHDVAIALHSLDRQMLGNAARTAVPEFMYREYKALYLELREGDGGGAHTGTTDILSVALAENSRPTQRTGPPLSQCAGSATDGTSVVPVDGGRASARPPFSLSANPRMHVMASESKSGKFTDER